MHIVKQRRGGGFSKGGSGDLGVRGGFSSGLSGGVGG